MLVTSRKVVDGWLDEWMDDSWFVKLIKQEYLSVYSWHGEIFIAIRNWNLVCWGVWLWRIENIDELRDFFSSLWNEWIIIIIIIQISQPGGSTSSTTKLGGLVAQLSLTILQTTSSNGAHHHDGFFFLFVHKTHHAC